MRNTTSRPLSDANSATPEYMRCLVPSWLVAFGLALLGGCTPIDQFVQNGGKVGPDYQRPPVPLAPNWIDAKNPQVKSAPTPDSNWWAALNDPTLNNLIKTAYEHNVTLRVAGTRVLEARAQRAIAVGTLFPQQQTANGSYQHTQVSKHIANVPPKRFFDTWATSLNASWEIDFWGKIRRQIESADDAVDSSVDDYDNAMVTLIGDVATAYVQYRILEQQLVYARQNVNIQKGSLALATVQWKAGKTGELPVVQASSLLQQLEATIPALEIGMRQANNQLCVLIGAPVSELASQLGEAPIPTTPPEIVVGIPADLIRRRPDIRSTERLIAAQNAQIGVADADFYPAFFINGTIGYQSQNLGNLVSPGSFTGQVGPAFQWNILNYGRILNNVRLQDFKTQELVASYQQQVLSAGREVEDGIITYLNAKREAELLQGSVKDARRALKLVNENFNAQTIDYTPVFVAEQFLAQQENLYAQAEGDVALGLINVYRALGGGWEYRLHEQAACAETPQTAPPSAAVVLPPPQKLPSKP